MQVDFHIRRVKHCAMNQIAWMHTSVLASPLALLFDLISCTERLGIVSWLDSLPLIRYRKPSSVINQVSFVSEGKNFSDGGRLSGIVMAKPPIKA